MFTSFSVEGTTDMGVELHTLKELVGKDRNYPLTSKGRLQSVVAKVKTNAEARPFARLLKSDKDLLALFSMHWTQLSVLEEASLPVLVSLAAVSEESKATIEREARKGEERGTFTLERILADAEPRLMKQVEGFLGSLEASGVPLEGIDQGTIVLHFMKAFGLFSTGSPIRGLIKVIKPFEDYIADEIGDVALLLLSATKSHVLSWGAARRAKVIMGAALDEKRFESAIRKLKEEGFVRPVLALAWCEGHKDFPTSVYLVGHRDLPDLKCDICGRGLNHATFYVLTSGAMTLARQYQGVLPHLFAWMLEEGGTPWNSECYLEGESDSERDLVFVLPSGEVCLVETKTFATDASERGMKSNLANGLSQLNDQISGLQERGIRVKYSALAVNYRLTDELRSAPQALLDEGKYPALGKTEFLLTGLYEWHKIADLK